MTWVAVAVAGAAVIGAGASMAGAEKQAKASKKASNQQMAMFERLNAQQQPYIGAGYGATQKLNTLLGIGGSSSAAPGAAPGAPPMGQPQPMPTPFVPDKQIPQPPSGPSTAMYGAPAGAQALPLKHILTMRAQQGDPDAQRILGNF